MISIIMPVFNEEKHLEECLDSILNQSLPDWELVAVNDFSSDQTESILHTYSLQDSRISYYNNQEKGIIPALNLAYRRSKYDVITRMDGDDIMPIYKLESLFTKLQKHPGACITGKVKYFSTNQLQEGFLSYATWLNHLIDNQNHYQSIYEECVVPSPCWMLDKKTIEKVGGITNEIYPEDYELIFRLYYHKIPIIGIDKVLHLWRDHPTRASRNDTNYQDQGFYPLKASYFLKTDRDENKELVVWGCGTAGKQVAKQLLKHSTSFYWTCQNENKIGREIYGIQIEPFHQIIEKKNLQMIIAIKQKNFKSNQKETFEELRKNNCELYFFH